MRTYVVLVVEDDAIQRTVIGEYSENAGFEVVEASDGSEAMAIFRTRPDIAAVFSCVNVPGMPHGIALAAHMRKVIPECAVVVTSGIGLPATRRLADGVRFVMKPYDGGEVVRLVREMIDGRKG